MQKRFLLISILPQKQTDDESFHNLRELKFLVDAYGGIVADWILQKREVHDKGNYIGSGKITEATEIIKTKQIDIVVLNSIIKPGQLHELKKTFFAFNNYIEVWDRVDLILQIFSKHARTAEARLQIELATMRHMGPRIYGMGMELSRQSGGIGMRGIGETNTERMKRHWREQMKKTQDKLKKLANERHMQLERRKRVGLATVSLVGYTNAGKTSLFNLLTGKQKLVKNALFATLDSAVGKVFIPEIQKTLLFSDTIGFISNLPTQLIEAFRSTLMESIHADLLLHVIDATDEQLREKIAVVEHILFTLKVHNKKCIYIFNKIDHISKESRSELRTRYKRYTPQFISTKTGEGKSELLAIIEEKISETATVSSRKHKRVFHYA